MVSRDQIKMAFLTASPKDAEGVLDLVRLQWKVDDTPIPIPIFDPVCPECGGVRVVYRMARYFRKGNDDATTPYRCDAGFKCVGCSLTWTHGVVIPKEMWEAVGGKRISFTRKQIRRLVGLDQPRQQGTDDE